MKIVYGDVVDFEPLKLRFTIDLNGPDADSGAVADFVLAWMGKQRQSNQDEWNHCKCMSAEVALSGVVEASCEHFPADDIEQLAQAVAERFPLVVELRVGDNESGSALLGEIDWLSIPAGRVVIDGVETDVDSFEINFTQITAGQFVGFLDATSYTPVPDLLNAAPGSTIRDFQFTFGKSPKIPLRGVTHDDAIAFADWAGYRLPTDEELRLFFDTAMVRMKKEINWSGYTWTSTPAGQDQFVVRDGPYQSLPNPEHDPHRISLHRHHYQLLEAPGIRVVRCGK